MRLHTVSSIWNPFLKGSRGRLGASDRPFERLNGLRTLQPGPLKGAKALEQGFHQREQAWMSEGGVAVWAPEPDSPGYSVFGLQVCCTFITHQNLKRQRIKQHLRKANGGLRRKCRSDPRRTLAFLGLQGSERQYAIMILEYDYNSILMITRDCFRCHIVSAVLLEGSLDCRSKVYFDASEGTKTIGKTESNPTFRAWATYYSHLLNPFFYRTAHPPYLSQAANTLTRGGLGQNRATATEPSRASFGAGERSCA